MFFSLLLLLIFMAIITIITKVGASIIIIDFIVNVMVIFLPFLNCMFVCMCAGVINIKCFGEF